MNKRREGEKAQKLYSVAKEDHSKKDHSFMMSAKPLKFRLPTFSPYPETTNFDLSSFHSLTPLTGILYPHRSNFGIFHENFNN